MKDKTECFFKYKNLHNFKIGTIFVYVIKILEIICYLKIFLVLLHRN